MHLPILRVKTHQEYALFAFPQISTLPTNSRNSRTFQRIPSHLVHDPT